MLRKGFTGPHPVNHSRLGHVRRTAGGRRFIKVRYLLSVEHRKNMNIRWETGLKMVKGPTCVIPLCPRALYHKLTPERTRSPSPNILDSETGMTSCCWVPVASSITRRPVPPLIDRFGMFHLYFLLLLDRFEKTNLNVLLGEGEKLESRLINGLASPSVPES